MDRDGATEAQVRARMAGQADPDEAAARTRALGGTVVDNGSELDVLGTQADALVRALIGPD
jgi:dephospho-CoA kinase